MTYDYRDPAIAEMISYSHKPVDAALDPRQLGDRVNCKRCKEEWPCRIVKELRAEWSAA